MDDLRFQRTEMLVGEQSMARLRGAKVLVFGVGGVGGYVVEALARNGVGRLDLIDGDVVAVSNVNRQIIALESTIGKSKAEVAKQRVLDINPDCDVRAYNLFFDDTNADQFDFSAYDYVVDAIDSIDSKILLIERAFKSGTRIISSMGAGNKLNATAFEVTDVYKTSVCPLAKKLRHELKSRGVTALKVVYSKEEPVKSPPVVLADGRQVHTIGSISFVPSVAGLIIGGEVIKDLIADCNE